MHWPADKPVMLDTYRQNGFVVVRSLFSPAEVTTLSDHLERYQREIVPSLPEMDVFYEDKHTHPKAIRMLPRMELHDDFFRDLLADSKIRDLATCLQGRRVRTCDAAFFNKPPRTGELTPPHQDGYYFHLDPCEAITVWVALTEVNELNGCLRYIRGSHVKGMRPHAQTNVLGFSQGITDFPQPNELDDEIAICLAAGDAIAHDAMTIHRADPNRSDNPRPALGFVYFSDRANVDTAARDQYQETLQNKLRSDSKI